LKREGGIMGLEGLEKKGFLPKRVGNFGLKERRLGAWLGFSSLSGFPFFEFKKRAYFGNN